jgi:Carboxypeptidase regulatory-like domain
MNRQVSRIALAFVLIFGVTMFALAQQSKQGRISGRVTDPQDYVVYQADVQIVNLDTHAATPQKTDTTGSFLVESLAAGRYQVTIQGPGFVSYKSAAITLAAGQELVQNVQLRKSGNKD